MNITWEVVAAFGTALSFVGGIWYRVESMVRKNTDALATHKLHVAENYVSKVGLKETVAPVMEMVRDIKVSIAYLTERIDDLANRQTTRPRRPSA